MILLTVVTFILLCKCPSATAQIVVCEENTCDHNADCVMVQGSPLCNCRQGYAGNGTSCENIDECEESSRYGCRVCGSHATCTDTDGSYNCTCNPGYNGNGFNCRGPDVICSSSISPLSVDVFTPTGDLIRRIGCHTQYYGGYYYNIDCHGSYYYPLLYNITFTNHQSILISEHSHVRNTLVAEWFEEGTHVVNISVCRHPYNRYNVCISNYHSVVVDLGPVTISVMRNNDSLFPYGNRTQGSSFNNVVDGAVEINPPKSIPFFNSYYRNIYVSSNGIVTFNRRFISWSPTPFPFGRSRVPVIAPLWVDFDFRNTLSCSGVFYSNHVDDGSPSLGRAILNEFNRRLNDSNFHPQWITIITWKESTPYPFYVWQYLYNYGRATFQLVIATDYIQTHAFYIYASSTITPFTWQRAVVGYDAKDFQNYFNLNRKPQDLVRLHTVAGNTGRTGEWHFNFTSPPGQDTGEQRCRIWARKQRGQLLDISSIQTRHCPCTRQQAERDWRFWFGYFWGLSSSLNCATVLFSGSQHTLECCYNRFGALIADSMDRGAGSYKLYHPLIFSDEHYQEDILPYHDCCMNSRRCKLYHTFRPIDDCSRYTPLIPSFMFGDPHLQTLDRRSFPFNGIGEYILVHTPTSVGFDVQARMETVSRNVTGTVITNIVVKLGDVPGIEVEAGSQELSLYVGGVHHELAVGDSPLIVSSSGIFSINLTGGIRDIGDLTAMFMRNEQLSVRMDSANSIIIGIGEGGTVTVSLQTNFLALSVALPDSYKNLTSGLLGVFNDNPNDDFRDRNETVLNLSTEREIYEQFGLLWHLNEEESLFNYTIGATSYSAINDGYLVHQPLFTDDLSLTEEVREMCQGNPSCIYDSTVTGNMEIGMSTLGVSTANNRTVQILENSPPVIEGNFTLFANAGVAATKTFFVRDPDDGDTVDTFMCLDDVEGFRCTRIGGNTLQVRWLNPMTPFPNISLRILANDSAGALTIRGVSVILCQCNSGSCIIENSDLDTFENGYYQRPCRCPSFFSGDSCEIDERGCGEFSLCIGAVCINDSRQDSGYICGSCLPGYGSSQLRAGDKCIDINECGVANDCTQVCTNTEGSYTCSCRAGFSLMDDQITCADIDECSQGNSSCSQTCINALGTYVCTCEPGYSLGTDGRTCHIGSCGVNPCSSGLSCVEIRGQYECLCDIGQRCNESTVCRSTGKNNLMHSTQTCEECPEDTYGVRCSRNCSGCSDNGNCDRVRGCICNSGWSGLYCDQELNLFSPSFASNTPTRQQIPWTLTAGVEITRIVASDNDTGPNATLIRYSFIDSPYPLPYGISNGQDSFIIDPVSGLITVLRGHRLDRRTESQFLLTIEASDAGQPSRSALHTLNLIPVSIPELQTSVRVIRVNEEIPLGTMVAQLFCEEIGPPSNSLQITLSGQELLRYDAITGLEVARRIDYESLSEEQKEYNITATCSNRFDQTDNVTIAIVINNINDNPFHFEHPRYSLLIRENATIGETILIVSASDRDFQNANITYSLEQGTEAADFLIEPHTGEVLIGSSLDRETQSMYVITVHAAYTNMTGLVERTSSMLTIHIADINDESPRFDQELYNIQNITADNQIGDIVVTVSVSDADTGVNGEVTYYLEQENTGFRINESTGSVYITSPLTHGLYNLTVIAEDGGQEPRSSSSLIYIHVLGGSILLTLSDHSVMVSEDIPIGSSISLVSYTVLDNNNVPFNESSVRFEIVNASDTDRFMINETTGEIFTIDSLDYESLATQYLLIIRATLDSPNQELINETVLRIVVENLDDTPPRFSQHRFAIAVEQFTLPNVTIITSSAMDPDALNHIEYSISGNDSTSFQINMTTGELSSTLVLSFLRDYQFMAVATESDSGEEVSAIIFISVSRSPLFAAEVFTLYVLENVDPGEVVGKVLLAREDFLNSAGTIRFRILSNPVTTLNTTNTFPNISQSLFHIDPVSGNVSIRETVDFDADSQTYILYVEMYNIETGTAYDTALVDIQLEDVNDNPPVFIQSLYTKVIDDSLVRDTIVIVVTATDGDSGNNSRVTYSFEQQSRNHGFTVDSTTGVISISNFTLIPGYYNLTVVASDGGNPALTDYATIFVTVIHFIPASIEFTEQLYGLQVVENSSPDTLIGTVQATDSNSSIVPSSIMYSMPNLTDCFSLDMVNGDITLSCSSLDREEMSSYELEVTAQVGNVTTSAVVIINVLDVNDNAPAFSLQTYAKILNNTHDASDSILQVTATDLDHGNNGTVTYTLISETNLFRINSSSGELFLANGTVEAIGDYELLVEATDMGTPNMISSTTVLIYVTTPHPQILRFTSVNFNVTENAVENTTVGFVALETNEGNTVDAHDYPGDLLFSIVGEDSDLFMIEETTGHLRVASMRLDREEAASHVVEVQANFTRFDNVPVQSITASFLITVLDSNDNSPVMLTNYDTTIHNSAESGDVIINITATDIDIGSNAEVSFSIDSPNAFGVQVAGSIPPLTHGEIFVNDAEILVAGIYQFTLTATDSGFPPMQSIATVMIIVEHIIPERIFFSSLNYTFSILEETPEGTFAGNVLILPETPALNGLVYSITGGSGRSIFSIDPVTGVVRKQNRRIDRERNSLYYIDIQAYLPNQEPPLITTAVATISVEDINDNSPRFALAVYPTIGVSTDELSTSNSILTVSATDIDIGSNAEVQYIIQSVTLNQIDFTSSSPFILSSSTGELFPAPHEIAVGSYILVISAYNSGQPRMNGSTSVTIVVQRPAPSSIAFTNSSGYTLRLPEQSGNITFARAMLKSIPYYLLQYVTYHAEHEYFNVDSQTGDVSAQRDFDYEVDEREFSFQVTAMFIVPNRLPQAINLNAVVNFTVLIGDVNDHSPLFLNFPYKLTQYEERTASEIIHTFTASDDDSGSNMMLRYSILNSNLSSLLTIDSISGQLIAASNLDRENSLQGRNHTVMVQVCDSGSVRRCTENTTIFRLLDINDNSPRLSSGFSYSVNERLPAQTVFLFVGMDPDLEENGTIRYHLTSANIPFTCNEVTGQVSSTQELDYELQPSYNIMLTLRDTGDPVSTTTYSNITVSVVDLPDNAPQFSHTLYHTGMQANVSAGEVLIQIQATDADIGFSNDSLRYAITGIEVRGNSGDLLRITVGEDSGVIVSEEAQVLVPGTQFVISLLVYDQSAFNLTNMTTLNIIVAPNSLTFTEAEYSVMVSEDASLGSSIATVNLDPLSLFSSIQYSFDVLEPDLPPGLIPFTINGNGTSTAILRLDIQGNGLNRELIDRYTISVTASNPNETAHAQLILEVTDVNDNSPKFLDSEGTVIAVPRNALPNSYVSTLNFTDMDAGDNAWLNFSILEANIPFEINGSGVIQTRDTLDGDNVLPFYNITVHVYDSGQPRLEAFNTYSIMISTILSLPPTETSPAITTSCPTPSITFPLIMVIFVFSLVLILVTVIILFCAFYAVKTKKKNRIHIEYQSHKVSDGFSKNIPLHPKVFETTMDNSDDEIDYDNRV